MRPRVVHVIQALSRGGAARSLLATATAASDLESIIVSLTPADPWMASQAQAAGLALIDTPTAGRLRAELGAADIVTVHFWNSPELYAFLRGDLPPLRLAVWAHVAGDTPPHIVTSQLVEMADIVVAASPYTARLPVFGDPPPVIVDAADLERVRMVERRPHATFNVGYVGTVDFAKMHPQYVELSMRVEIPDARFIVCGSGGGFAELEAQVKKLGADDRFELVGYVEDVGRVLAGLDVFGYPLAPGNYSASDLALQEAMSAGVPPVVLPYGGTHTLVRDGETGVVAPDESEYPRAIERLHRNPRQRARLGRNAREEAANWGPDRAAEAWSAVYERLLQLPKRRRAWPADRLTGAAAFVESLGGTAPEFAASLNAPDDEAAREAELLIAAAGPVLTSAGGGGVLHYRRHDLADGRLRLWAGLILEAAGQNALAVAEYDRAAALGCAPTRVHSYLARAAIGIGAERVADALAAR